MTNDVQRAQAVTAARRLLSLYRDAHHAWSDDCTPIDDLVRCLGFDLETFHPSDRPGTFGYVDEEGNPIWLCRDLAETLRRFTLAHELGHAVLHTEREMQPEELRRALEVAPFPSTARADVADPCQQDDILENRTGDPALEYMQEVLGTGMTYNPRGEREQIANVFAAELLMPLERVRSLYMDRTVAPNTLANRFNVSNSAMLNRLVGLAEEMVKERRDAANGVNEGRGDACPRPTLVDAEQTAPSAKAYDEYQQAATSAPTPALIVAGPGSGKTSTLIGRVEYLIRQEGVAPEHILALTFSRKAAEEMEERLRRRLPGSNSTMPTVSTFHAFCAETLRTYGGLVGLRPDFALVDGVGGYFLLRGQAREMRLTHYANLLAPDYYFSDFLSAISRAKDELVTPERYDELARRMLEEARDEDTLEAARKALEVAGVYALYEDALRQRQDTDFGGLVMITARLLESNPDVQHEIQEKYQHILVDEFQDMNRASGVLLRLLAGEARRVWVVGDANQAIYSFRGASPANITQFEQDYPGAVVLPLSSNYRSLPDIVQLSEAFRARQLELGEKVEPIKNWPARLTQPDTYITLAVAPDNAAELAGLVDDVRRKHEQGYAYRDIAVLCRTRAQMRKVAQALAAADMPVVEQSTLLGQDHVKDILATISLLAEASGMGVLRAARQIDHPITQQDVETLLLSAREQHVAAGLSIMRDEPPAGMSAAGRHALTLLSSMLQALGIYAADVWSLLAQYLFIETPIMRDIATPTFVGVQFIAPNRYADYMALLQLARRYDQQQRAAREQRQREVDERGEMIEIEPPKIQEQVRDFLDYLRVLLSLGHDGIQREQPGADEEEQADVIRVMTVHASKGLEFPVVYLPNLRQNSFPTINRKSSMPPPHGMIAAERESEIGHAGGEACLFYVGVTRARDRLVLSYSERNGKQKAKPSMYLDSLLNGQAGERVDRVMWNGNVGAQFIAPTEDESDETLFTSTTASFQPGAAFLEAMKPVELHASALETYLRCPRQYFYSNVCGFSGEAGLYQLFWQATQHTLETLKERAAGADGLISDEEAKELYTRHWRELGGPAQPFAALYEQHGHEIAALIRNTLLASSDTQWELRSSITVEVAGRTIHLSVDRVERPQQEGRPARFVRTKVGKRKEKPAAGHREYLYAQAYKQHHSARAMELYFHNLSTGETIPISFTPKKEQKLYEELRESIEALEHSEFPPRPDARLCPACPYFFVCPT